MLPKLQKVRSVKADEIIRAFGVAEIPTGVDFMFWLTGLRDEARDDRALSNDARAFIDAQFDTLNDAIKRLNKSRELGSLQTAADDTLQSVADALHASMAIGAYYVTSSRVATKLTRKMKKAHTQPARKGRSRPDITAIILPLADQQMQIDSNLIGHPYKIAGIIFSEVTEQIREIGKVPKWLQLDPKKPIESEQTRIIENIAKRIINR